MRHIAPCLALFVWHLAARTPQVYGSDILTLGPLGVLRRSLAKKENHQLVTVEEIGDLCMVVLNPMRCNPSRNSYRRRGIMNYWCCDNGQSELEVTWIAENDSEELFFLL